MKYQRCFKIENIYRSLDNKKGIGRHLIDSEVKEEDEKLANDWYVKNKEDRL